jgi:hypothetical protein
MKNHSYPTPAELAAMGITLERDVRLCSPALLAWFGRAHVQIVRTRSEERRPEPRHFTHKRAGKRIA